MHFHQRRHPVLGGQFAQPAQFLFFENRGDQQNRVGAVCGGFDHMEFVDREILAQDWQGHRRARGLQIAQFALEKLASVSTLKAAAPPLEYVFAMEAGSN